LPIGAKLLSIILYSDATTTDTLGKSQLHLIYLSLGNIPIWRRNKLDAKQLLGYLPILKATDKDLVHKVFHKSLRHLLEPIILLKDGVDLMVNNEKIWFYPRVSTIIADWPEAASFCLVYKSPNSTFPCHFCLVRKNDLANTDLSSNDIILRTHDKMREHLEDRTQNSVCIESVPNFFWDLP
jgi:Plavaka transposase